MNNPSLGNQWRLDRKMLGMKVLSVLARLVQDVWTEEVLGSEMWEEMQGPGKGHCHQSLDCFSLFFFFCFCLFKKSCNKADLKSFQSCVYPNSGTFFVMLISFYFKEQCQFTRSKLHGVFNLNRGVAKPSPKRNIFIIQLFYQFHSLGVVHSSVQYPSVLLRNQTQWPWNVKILWMHWHPPASEARDVP